MRYLKILMLTALVITTSIPAWADTSTECGAHGCTHQADSRTGSQASSANVYADAMSKMHQAMPTESSGNADVDFIRGMIPHHQGAIDMAEIALQKSTDPFVRKLATDIVAAQKSEIAAMQDWLAAHDASKAE